MPSKRAASQSSQANKKAKKEKKEPWRDQQEMITETIRQFHEDSKLGEMLVDASTHCFDAVKSERHNFYDSIISMIGVTLERFHQEAQGKEAETQRQIDGAESIKEGNFQAVEVAEAELAKQNEILQQKEVVLKEQQAVLKEAKKEHNVKKTAMNAQCQGMKKLEVQLEELLEKKEIFETLKAGATGKAADIKKKIDDFVSAIKKLDMEDTLLVCLPLALKKPAEDRKPFDNSIVVQTEKNLHEMIAGMNGDIAKQRADNHGVISERDSAAQMEQAAKANVDGTKSEIEAVELAIADLEERKEQAETDVKNHEKNLKKTVRQHAENQETRVRLGLVIESFVALKERDTPKLEEGAAATAEVEVEEVIAEGNFSSRE